MKCLNDAKGEMKANLNLLDVLERIHHFVVAASNASPVSRKRDQKINGFAYVELTQTNPKRKKKFESLLGVVFDFSSVNVLSALKIYSKTARITKQIGD